MKILKPGKVEQRKFVCGDCGCIFVADRTEMRYSLGTYYAVCPSCGNNRGLTWEYGESYGEPYEEPTQSDLERLNDIIREWNWWSKGTCGFAQYLLDNGVTFREG